MPAPLTLLDQGRLELLHGLELDVLTPADETEAGPEPVVAPPPPAAMTPRRMPRWSQPIQPRRERDFATLLQAATRASFDQKSIYTRLDRQPG